MSMDPSAMTLIYQQDPTGDNPEPHHIVITVNRAAEGRWSFDVTAEWLPAGSRTSYTLPAATRTEDVQAAADSFAGAMCAIHASIIDELGDAARRLGLSVTEAEAAA